MVIKDKIILIISPECWGENFVSKHHYARLLSAANKVFFLQPGTSFHKQEGSQNPTVINYKLPRGINRLPPFLREMIWKKYSKKVVLLMDCKPDLVWNFDPYVFQHLSLFSKEAIKIYHPVDVHQTNLDRICASEADLILSTTDLILNKFRDVKKPMFKVNHGLADHFISYPTSRQPIPQGQGRLKVGYLGNLNYPHLDYATLLTVLRENPDLDFYFIGPESRSNLGNGKVSKEIEEIKGLPNTFILGSKSSTELPGYLSQFDCFLMCYKGDSLPAQMANPHKLLEYLSTGKVVVTHYIHEYAESSLIEMCKKNGEIPSLFKYVSGDLKRFNSLEMQNERIAFAHKNSYSNHLATIAGYIEKTVKWEK